MNNPTRSSRDEHDATIDLSESNYEDFRETADTATASARAAGIAVNLVLHKSPDERSMRCTEPVG